MVRDLLYGYKMWCESTTENSNFILKTMDPDSKRLCSIHKQRRRAPNFLVHMVSYYNLLPYGLPIHGARMGSPGRYCGAQTFNNIKNPSM